MNISGMSIGPGRPDNRGTARRRVGVSEAAVERMAGVTKATLQAWEERYDDQLPGRHSDRERGELVARLADVYASLVWLAGGCAWPRHLEDEPLRAAVERMRMAELP